MKPRCMSNENHKNLKIDKANNNKEVTFWAGGWLSG